MKITIIADTSGTILGFAQNAPRLASGASHETALVKGEGQELHAIEVPTELLQHFGTDKFDDEIFQHVVVKKGQKATLVRAPKKRGA